MPPAFFVLLLALLHSEAVFGAEGSDSARVFRGAVSAPPAGTVSKLDGDWRFKSAGGNSAAFMPVPGVWNSVQDAFGAGTYELTIEGLLAGRRYALQFKRIDSWARVSVDGRELGVWGGEGLDFRPRTFWFEPAGPTAVLAVEVENRVQSAGGIWAPVLLGLADDIEYVSARDRFFDILVLGAILMMGLYHAAIYLFRSSDRATLFFGLFCLITGLKSGLSGEQVLSFALTSLSGEIGLRIAYLAVILLPLFFLAYLRNLFPRHRSALPMAAFGILGTIQGIVCLAAPIRIVQGWFFPYQIAILAACVYVFLVIVEELRLQNAGARPIMFGYAVLFASILNDILHDNKIIASFYSLNLGLFAFLFTQAIVMGKLYARSFQEARDLNETLERRVAERTVELERLSRIDPLTGLWNRR